jgi:VanZ family protein
LKSRIIPAIVWLTLILFATLSPGKQLPKTPDINGFDKLIHLGLFLILTLLWNRAWDVISGKPKTLNKSKLFTNYLVFGILFAILVEYLQQYVPDRSFDYGDMIANITGGTLGTICYYLLHRTQSN